MKSKIEVKEGDLQLVLGCRVRIYSPDPPSSSMLAV
jgi:hypothetical protein